MILTWKGARRPEALGHIQGGSARRLSSVASRRFSTPGQHATQHGLGGRDIGWATARLAFCSSARRVSRYPRSVPMAHGRNARQYQATRSMCRCPIRTSARPLPRCRWHARTPRTAVVRSAHRRHSVGLGERGARPLSARGSQREAGMSITRTKTTSQESPPSRSGRNNHQQYAERSGAGYQQVRPVDHRRSCRCSSPVLASPSNSSSSVRAYTPSSASHIALSHCFDLTQSLHDDRHRLRLGSRKVAEMVNRVATTHLFLILPQHATAPGRPHGSSFRAFRFFRLAASRRCPRASRPLAGDDRHRRAG